MNPTFTLSIDLEKRKISATGLVAVGEKVDVVVKGVDYSSIPVWETDNTEGFIGPALRFRLVTPEGKDLVRFPLAEGDGWNKDGDSLSAEVDFNTMQLRDWLRGFPIAEKAEVGIIIDSVVDAMEYGRGTVKILQWAASPAEDPTILPDWRKTLRELNAAIVEISYKSEQAVDAATLAESAKELAQKYVNSANVAANNALNSENEAKRFRNESLTAEQSASASANDASGARADAESAKVAAETARDEAREYAESAQNTLEIVATKAELQNEVARATQSEAQIDGKINTIIADDAGKSARTIAAEEVAKVVADAPADFDTLKEIAEYIESDKTGAAQMVTKIDANANAISAEAQRAQDAEAALRQAVEGKVDVVEGKGLSTNDYTDAEKSKLAGIAAGAQVNPTPIAPVNATESGMFADAYWTKQDLAGKADKVAYAIDGNLAALDSNGNLVDSGNMVAGAFTAGSFIGRGDGQVGFQLSSTSEGVELYVNDGAGKILKFPLREGTLAVQDDIAPTFDETDTYDKGALVFHDGLYQCVNPNGHTGAWVAADFAEATVEDLLAALRTALAGKQDALSQEQVEAVNSGITANKVSKLEGIEVGAQKNPDLSGYATKDAALPRYYFTILEVVDGVLTVPPYTSAYIPGSNQTAFTIAVSEGNSMYLRDCILCVQCGNVAPTINWPANFHPRTDAETDFACVAGAMNVYWISEYAQGEFAVAGWQATAGGSAV